MPANIDPGCPDGLNADLQLSKVLSAAAFNLLTDAAKGLTVGQTWRLNGWALAGQPAPKQDPILKNLSMDDVSSIARALEVHIRDKGNTQGWKYVNPTYACGGCCTCAVVVPPDMTR